MGFGEDEVARVASCLHGIGACHGEEVQLAVRDEGEERPSVGAFCVGLKGVLFC